MVCDEWIFFLSDKQGRTDPYVRPLSEHIHAFLFHFFDSILQVALRKPISLSIRQSLFSMKLVSTMISPRQDEFYTLSSTPQEIISSKRYDAFTYRVMKPTVYLDNIVKPLDFVLFTYGSYLKLSGISWTRFFIQLSIQAHLLAHFCGK